jgi:hypothetical protein
MAVTGPASGEDATVFGRLVDAELRRLSARTTKVLAERFGARLGMWFGAGYPRSGTTYLCNLMSSYLDLPLVRLHRLPVLMPCVLHSHWLPSRRTQRTIYVVRDGREVIVSRYFYDVASLTRRQNPRGAQRRRDRFNRLYGARADLRDVAANLPKFIEAEMTEPHLTGVSWPHHVTAWLNMPPERVAVVRYEGLCDDVGKTLAPALERLSDEPIDDEYLRLAGERHNRHRRRSPQADGEARSLRPASGGDWRNYFTAEASEVFSQYAGAVQSRLGYLDEAPAHDDR